ncbi:MAG: hypothetical protein AAF938_27175 [Myxococcota bacterium]
MRSFFLIVVAAAAVACTQIDSVDNFQFDPSCDLDMPMTDFGTHSNATVCADIERRHEFFIEVVREVSVEGASTLDRRDFLAYLDPLPSPEFQLTIPNVVEGAANATEGRARIEFYADQGRDGLTQLIADNPPTSPDHQWAIPAACDANQEPFVHLVSNFVNLSATRVTADGEAITEDSTFVSRGRGTDLIVRFRDPRLPDDEEGRNRLTAETLMRNVEVRVTTTVVEDDREVIRPLAFARRAAVNEPPRIESDAFQSDLVLPDVLDEGLDVNVVVFFDRDGDGELQTAGDLAFNFVVPAATVLVDACESNTEEPVCSRSDANNVLQAFEIRVNLEPTDTNFRSRVTELEPWWRVPDGQEPVCAGVGIGILNP